VAITDQMRSSHRWPASLRELRVTWVEEFRAIRPSRRQRSAQTAPTSPAKRQQNVDGARSHGNRISIRFQYRASQSDERSARDWRGTSRRRFDEALIAVRPLAIFQHPLQGVAGQLGAVFQAQLGFDLFAVRIDRVGAQM
jgi:hypothetical protein